MKEEFTRYETARIIGARALQIAMDAPILLKIPEETLESIKYDALKIAELEFQENVLPISVHRPLPRRKEEKLKAVKEEKIEDEKIIERAQEEEKEIAEKATELGLVQEDEQEEVSEAVSDETSEEI